jgi:geranylgeranyl pyrophosphate synthase
MVFDLPAETIARKVKENFRRRGKAVHKQTQENILAKYSDDNVVSQALRYFAKVTLDGALPVFPALINLSCEAVGGNPKDSTSFGEAIVFITAAADLHDDIIDKSIAKRKKATVLGKFGSTITILAGDILLAEGLTLLSEATNKLSKEQAKEIMRLTSEAVFEISCAEALENQLRSKRSVSPQEYRKVIELKSCVPEVAMEIGAILGNASSTTVKALGAFGRKYGVIAENIEEFADLFEISEFQSRLQNECPPLPLLCALENPEIKTKFAPF